MVFVLKKPGHIRDGKSLRIQPSKISNKLSSSNSDLSCSDCS